MLSETRPADVLDRHQAARERGHRVVSLVDAESSSQWGAWAASRRRLALIVHEDIASSAIAALLAAFPWSRTLAAARERFAAVAGISVEAVDAAFDGRGELERWQYVLDAVGHDELALVSGWLLSSLRDTSHRAPPVAAARLLACAAELAAPIAVLVEPEPCTAASLERALGTAGTIASQLPRQPVAVAAPREVVRAVLSSTSAVRALAVEGRVESDASVRQQGDVVRSEAERVLRDALASDRRTAARFALNARLPGAPALEVDFVAERARLVVEIDGWYHFQEPERYRRDRHKDVVLQQRGYLVMRYLAEDVHERLAFVVDEIAIALAAREKGAHR